MLINAVKEHNLSAVVISACSPRMHETTFRKAADKAGINPYMVEIANIREHCAWVHKDKEEGTKKAAALTRAALAKVQLNQPLFPDESPVTKRALVIGGGIAGIQTALDIAEAGFPVDIVESTPSIGGKMAQLDKTFPTLDCAACILTPKMVDAAAHENITLYTYSEVDKVEGFVGDFTVTIRKKARSVDMTKCTGCGDCWKKCPAKKAPSEFDQGLRARTAIYLPFAQAVPNVPAIDRSQCTKFTTGKCGVCEKVCGPKAICFEEEDELVTEKYGAIVVATGYNHISMEKFGELAYNNSKDVITSLELERLLNAAGPTGGKLLRLSDNRKPKNITFLQCVGSRDISPRGKAYCSKICCMYTAKHAMLIRDKYPDIEVTVFFIDVRSPGKAFDEFYRRADEEYGVRYIKGQIGKVVDDGNSLHIQAIDMLDNRSYNFKTDMLVLAAAIEPVKSVRSLATSLTASIDTNNFMTEAHPKLRPVESPTSGVFLSGVCQGPKDIPETVAQAGAAAVKVIGLLVKDKLKTNPCVAMVDELYCNGCSACEPVCSYGAITYADCEINDHGVKSIQRLAQINKALCQGCGGCVVACPSGAMDLQGFSNRQIQAEVDAICR
jgi:heterodisulfide reductase subunit A